MIEAMAGSELRFSSVVMARFCNEEIQEIKGRISSSVSPPPYDFQLVTRKSKPRRLISAWRGKTKASDEA
jgi:hypothetical protein